MFGGVHGFSDILKISNSHDLKRGCIVDTSILFAYSYPNDNFNRVSSELFDYLSDLKIPLFTNANIRAEFVNNYFQVLVPEALNDLYQNRSIDTSDEMNRKLASNYTVLNEARTTSKSYKFNSTKVDEWRKLLRKQNNKNQDGWFSFCSSYVNHALTDVWDTTCAEAGINFLTLRGSDQKKWMISPIEWPDMVKIVGNYGVGSFDAMIINLFLNSHFSSLITADREIAKVIKSLKPDNKFVFVPDQLQA